MMRAELLANLVEAVAVLDDPSPAEVMRLTRVKLSVVPVVEPARDPAEVIAVPPPEALARRPERCRWRPPAGRRPAVGEELVYEWRCPARSLRKAGGAAG